MRHKERKQAEFPVNCLFKKSQTKTNLKADIEAPMKCQQKVTKMVDSV